MPIRVTMGPDGGGGGGGGGGGHDRGVVGLDFGIRGREQLCEFVDSRGRRHLVAVHLPAPFAIPEQLTWPTVVHIHGHGFAQTFFNSCNVHSDGIETVRRQFVVMSPLLPNLKDTELYFDTEDGVDVLSWLTELVQWVAQEGLVEYGQQWVDVDRLSITGVSQGGYLTLLLGAACNDILSAIAPVASYHAEAREEELVQGLMHLPIHCVHSSSHTERTCPIENERSLWNRIINHESGGTFQLTEVSCKHGKTFCWAYEHNSQLWYWILQQRRSSRV